LPATWPFPAAGSGLLWIESRLPGSDTRHIMNMLMKQLVGSVDNGCTKVGTVGESTVSACCTALSVVNASEQQQITLTVVIELSMVCERKVVYVYSLS